MKHTREQLKQLSLVELKNICKKYKISYGGSKTQLINNILETEKPDPIVINKHIGYKLGNKKIVSVMMTDSLKQIQIGKIKERGECQLLYYSMGVYYYVVNKDTPID